MHIINIDIDELGVATPTEVILGNKYENNDSKIIFKMPTEYDTFHKYLIFVSEQNAKQRMYDPSVVMNTNVLPIENDSIMVSSALTWTNSKKGWYMYVMARESELDLNQGTVDLTAKSNERISISDGFIGKVKTNYIDPANLQNAPLDSNLITAYDELTALKKEIESKLASGQFNGFSPTVDIKKGDKKTTITITDSVGPHIFEIVDGTDGLNGLSAYEIASNNGFVGTEKEWVESLKYDHSDEFSQLATQINQNAESAQTSAQAANASEVNAKASETKAKTSETNAKASETASKESETNAKASETVANIKASEASTSAQTASQKATTAETSANKAKASETNAKTSETNASESATAAKASEIATGQVVADATAQANRAKTEADRAKTNADTVTSSTQKITENAEQITQLKQDLTNKMLGVTNVDYLSKAYDSFEDTMKIKAYSTNETQVNEIRVCGKNLIPFPYPLFTNDITKHGISAHVNSDGSIYLKGTSTGVVYIDLCAIKFADKQLISGNDKTDGKIILSLVGQTSKLYLVYSSLNNKTYIRIDKDVSVDSIVYPQIEYGIKVTKFELYKQPKQIVLSQPIILRGKEVSENENVIIESKQYLSDVLCEKDGIIGVERYLSSTNEPQEMVFEALPEQDQQAIKGVKSFTPTTILQCGTPSQFEYTQAVNAVKANLLERIQNLEIQIGGGRTY